MSAAVAVLFARSDSVYKSIPGCDVWDMERDARNYCGSAPVVAHPPCRAWGRLRGLAKPRPDEKALALFAVDQVRRCGGVLEHPSSSSLWATAFLPRPGCGRDRWGGWSLEMPQKWFGHKAEKNSWFYIVGISPAGIPDIPYSMHEASHVVTNSPRSQRLKIPELSKAAREHTPEALARWLVELAASVDRCKS